MKTAISEITTLKADLESDLRAFSATGWNAVELSIEKADRYLADKSLEDLKRLLQDNGLKPVAAIGLAPTGPGLFLARGNDFSVYMQSLERQIKMCQTLDVPCLGIGADPAREVKDASWMDGAIENVRVAADLARAHSVSIGIEALSLSPPVGPFLLESLNETRAFVDRVNHGAVGINFDVFHFIRSGGIVADIAKVRPGQILHVHICDLPTMPHLEWEDKHRVMPGDGSLPMSGIRDAILALGYDGYWALELLNEDYWEHPVEEVAALGHAAMDKFTIA